MTLFKKPLIGLHRRKAPQDVHVSGVTSEYIDLSELVFEDEPGAPGGEGQCLVHVAELDKFEDLGALLDYVYNGDIMIIDYAPLSGDDLTLSRISSEIKSAVKDMGGDVAGVGKDMLMVTPTGIRISRSKLNLSEL
jgi:SepF-like predicted cell division protein (DUF552 family)